MTKTTRYRLSLVLLLILAAVSAGVVVTGEFRAEVGWLLNKAPGSQPESPSRSSSSPSPTITTSPTHTPSPTIASTPDPNAAPTIPLLIEAVEDDGTFGGSEGIAFVSDRDGNPEIYSFHFSDGQITRLTYSDMADFHPKWSPDGRWIAFTSYRDGGPDIHTISATGALRQSLTDSAWFDEFPSWSPDGYWILFDSNRPLSSESGAPVSQNGNEFRLYLMRTDGTELVNLLNDASDGAVGAFSPGGDQVVYQSRAGEGEYQIYTYDLVDDAVVRLTHTLARNFRPSWSPDGQQIVFISERDGAGEIYIMNADGTEQRRLTQGILDHVRGPAWSPDGAWILFNAELDGNTDVFVISVDGIQLYRVTQNPAEDYHPDWKPGRH